MTPRYSDRRRSGPYRMRHGMILGVCKGIAHYFEFSVFWTRMIAAALLVFFWPIIGLYLLAAMMMKPEPVLPFETEAEEEFYNSLTSSRQMALHRLKRTFDRLNRRIQRMEDIVTAREYDWEQRLNQ